MHRILFEFGDFKLYSYGLMILAGFAVALLLARRRAPRYGLTPGQVSDAAFWALLFGVLGARIGYVLQELPHYVKNWRELLEWQFQGLTSYGGFIAGGLVFVVYARRARLSIWALLDTVSAPFLLANAIGRVGCLMNGCCHGGACRLPWGVPVEAKLGLYHPAQIYESLLNMAALWILFRLERKGLKSGQSFGAVIVLYGAGRFIYEFWRAGSTSTYLGPLPITDAQLAAVVAIALGAFLFRRFGYHSGSPAEETSEASTRA